MKKAGMIAGVVLLMTVALSAVGCGGGGGAGATPTQVVEAYMNASLEKDADTAYGLLSEGDKTLISLEGMRSELERVPEDVEFSYTVGEEKVDGDEASVMVTLMVKDMESGETEEVPQTMYLIRENGEWRIHLGESS